jgi:SsrA-binding protein
MAMTKRNTKPASIKNRRAVYDYELGDSLIVGLQLSGAETKNLRQGHGQLRGAYITVKGHELWLINATVYGTRSAQIGENETTRPRKLLAKKREIERLIQIKQQGRTIVPLEIITKGKYIKLRISVGKGKKRYDKRQTLKARDDARRSAQAIAQT